MRSSEVALLIDLACHVPRSQGQPCFARKIETQLFYHRIVEARPSPEMCDNCIKSRNLAEVLVHYQSAFFLFRARTLNQIGLPINRKALRISLPRNRS